MIMLLVSMLFGSYDSEFRSACDKAMKAWGKLALTDAIGYCDARWNKGKKGCADLKTSLESARAGVESSCTYKAGPCDFSIDPLSPGSQAGCFDPHKYCDAVLLTVGAQASYYNNNGNLTDTQQHC
eukprot:NODE_385_length_9550_cov_0.159877.p5 type:complete len:126 gc:universal NODE_385_length_9550_cov_0.159877:7886-8263(+)